MNIRLFKITSSLLLLLAGADLYAQRSKYPDVLRLQTTVSDTSNVELSCFSDLGAWHAYALPEKSKDFGSFTGPLLMDMKGEWLANSFAQLQLSENGKKIALDSSKASIRYYPGMLQQVFETGGLKIVLKLIFVSNRESLLQLEMTNLSAVKRTIGMSWTGTALLSSARLQKMPDGLLVRFAHNRHRFEIMYQGDQQEDIRLNGNSYKTKSRDMVLQPGEQVATSQVHRYFLHADEQAAATARYDFAAEMKKNETRWDGYLEKYFSSAPGLDEAKQRLAVKSIITLLTNWRSKAKDLLHDGVFPSVNYQGFYGVWSWDSWKQAVALSYFHPALAQENVLCMFDYQDEHGMVADCIYTDKGENNWRDTKPPLSAWAVLQIFEQSNDADFVKEIYPKLVKYHQWWYDNRDHDQNGLCEYGSTDGTRVAAAWESGMDNAVRFDNAVMIKNNNHAWSLNQESVDLNAYLYAEKLYLAELALILQQPGEATQWKKEAGSLGSLVNKQFFDEDKGYYYDKLFDKQDLITVEGTEGWIPLWAGIAGKRQADKVVTIMADRAKFNTHVPLPTFTADHPKFNPGNGYWRGPVWLDQFYFGVEGLKKYGYAPLAGEFVGRLWKNADGLLGDKPIRENYHPLSGEGLNAINFSWSAAHILMLLKN